MKLVIRKIGYEKSVDYVITPIEVLPGIMDGQLMLSVYYYNDEEYQKAISEEIPDELIGDVYPSLGSIDIIVPSDEYKIIIQK